ncbi:serine/threonine-protein kinase [Nodosilinea sp. P-1105]|uniref:serine/threonine-protein kinase n=1 Tax=Nodosilinea sp. P-1105 TaxID=2546229 RepID=UPI003242AD35
MTQPLVLVRVCFDRCPGVIALRSVRVVPCIRSTAVMICCLNPHCPQPNHATQAPACPSCGQPLQPRLRGRYRPVKLIGRGGFGRTYFALDTDRLNNRCVIKQFAPQAQGTKSFLKAVQLFEQEALRLNELGEHPQIPTLLAYFEQGKYLYLVQQMIQGQTLYQELYSQSPYSENAVRLLLEDLLPVLQFIHNRGVIHRDITPTNIIRQKVDQKPVLIDFGVAKQFGEAIAYEAGTRIGTEGYSPIEQLRSGQAYPSSDLYSLGATCLHLLTGCKPEDLYSPLEGRWMWQEHLQEAGRTINEGLAEVLNRMTQDLVSDRYQTAQDVIRDLQRLPKLEGAVPGWSSSLKQDSLFTNLQPPISGPRDSLPPTAPPRTPPSKPPQGAPPASPPTPSQGSRSSGRRSTGNPQGKARSSTGGARSQSPGLSTGWQSVKELTGHQSWVMAVAFNPRLPTLASGSLDDTVRVWNWQTGQTLYSLHGHARGVNDVAISSGGQVLASCGDDAVVRVWNMLEGSPLHTLTGHLRDVTAVAIGRQGYILASGSEDGTLKLWSLDKGNLIKTLGGTSGMVKTVALAQQDQLLVSGGLDNKIYFWNINTAAIVKVLAGHTNTVNRVAISPDGRWLASASKDRTVRLWNMTNGDLVHVFRGHTQEVNAVSFFPDGQTLLSGSSDGTLRIWQLQQGSLQQTLSAHINPVHSVAIHGSGKLLASASADKTIKLWQKAR